MKEWSQSHSKMEREKERRREREITIRAVKKTITECKVEIATVLFSFLCIGSLLYVGICVMPNYTATDTVETVIEDFSNGTKILKIEEVKRAIFLYELILTEFVVILVTALVTALGYYSAKHIIWCYNWERSRIDRRY